MGLHNLVPRPVSVIPGTGATLEIIGQLRLFSGVSSEVTARVMPAAKRVAASWQLPLEVVDAEETANVSLRYLTDLSSEAAAPAEGYRLNVDSGSVQIQASSAEGFLRALSTLTQLADRADQTGAALPPVVISDQPRFSGRGLSLDVARSFYPVEEIKLVVDLLARYRMNHLHLHLTDDQGWRLDVPARPALTATSGNTAVTGGRPGFYSRSDIEAIIQYAATWAST